jgi:8-oxo-dGTP diphosphatase
MPLLLVVAAAIIDSDGRVLLTQRPKGKELDIDVTESCLAPLTFASHAYENFHLLMPLYVLRRWKGTVTSRESQAMKWVHARDLRQHPMPPADLPLIPHLQDLL